MAYIRTDPIVFGCLFRVIVLRKLIFHTFYSKRRITDICKSIRQFGRIERRAVVKCRVFNHRKRVRKHHFADFCLTKSTILNDLSARLHSV